jgi:hypothetical protein
MHGSVGQGNIGDVLRTLGNDHRGPEASVDVDRLVAVRVPLDPHRTITFHTPILTGRGTKGLVRCPSSMAHDGTRRE